MKIHNKITATKVQLFRGTTVPMFLPESMDQTMANDATTQDNAQEQDVPLSLFDVKELYDMAYAEKAKGAEGLDTFKKILAEAVKLDLAYRRQLTKTAIYKDRTKLKKFKTATDGDTTSAKVA